MSLHALEQQLHMAAKIGKVPKVVIPVDFSGLPCDYVELRKLADQYGFKIVQDASHAIGASYAGRPVGAKWADITVFSTHAVKIVTTGEGGIVVTDNDELAIALKRLRSHGMTRDRNQMTAPPEGDWVYEQLDLGFNYRMTDIQAALGSSQLTRLAQMQVARERLADRYDELLAGMPVIKPPRASDRRSSWHLYVVELLEGSRKQVFDAMRADGIGVIWALQRETFRMLKPTTTARSQYRCIQSSPTSSKTRWSAPCSGRLQIARPTPLLVNEPSAASQ
jgi:dTDP-4-amino-4,6-dideoxygalactose transaminase